MIEYTVTSKVTTLEEVPKDAVVTSIDGRSVVGRCEVCRTWLVEGDDYEEDFEGVLVCKNCGGRDLFEQL